MKRFLILGVALAALTGCGPDKSEVARSELNQLADKWDGAEKFAAEGNDPWGQAYTAQVDKGAAYYTLTLRSNGPDKLPQNRDDVVVTRMHKHTPLGEAAAPAVEKIGEAAGKGVGRGAISGIREGLFGKKGDKQAEEKKDEGKKEEPKK
jgi:hypothetical protein